MTLPTKLRILRARAGLTLVDAAKKIGIGRDTLSDLEKGRRHPIMPTLRAIADAYGVPVEELVEEEPSEEPSAQQWAREQKARLHGMTDEEWDVFVRDLDTHDEVADAFREFSDENVMLHAALRADKWFRPANREHRLALNQGKRELRIHRLADLQAQAMLIHARDLVQEIYAAMMEEEARA